MHPLPISCNRILLPSYHVYFSLKCVHTTITRGLTWYLVFCLSVGARTANALISGVLIVPLVKIWVQSDIMNLYYFSDVSYHIQVPGVLTVLLVKIWVQSFDITHFYYFSAVSYI